MFGLLRIEPAVDVTISDRLPQAHVLFGVRRSTTWLGSAAKASAVAGRTWTSLDKINSSPDGRTRHARADLRDRILNATKLEARERITIERWPR